MKAAIAIGVLVLSTLVTGCKTEKKTEDKAPPNIIFLMDDQHRWDALGVVNPVVVTPNLDRLAKEGYLL